MSVGTLSMARNGSVYFEGYQLGTRFVDSNLKVISAVSLVAVRYVAQAALSVSLPKGFGFYRHCTDLEIGCFL